MSFLFFSDAAAHVRGLISISTGYDFDQEAPGQTIVAEGIAVLALNYSRHKWVVDRKTSVFLSGE